MGTNPKSFTVDVPPEVSRAFSDHADEQGYTKWKAVMGALRVYMVLSPDAQVCANNLNKTLTDLGAVMEKVYRDALLLKFLEALTPEQQAFVIEAARDIAKRLFPETSKET